ncbi:hypothetical protein KTT_51900 [Tengunoibacter tsumagoiensis]|uniref:PAS domain-containing protein n=1 Tax=Tengunoibacter tsumagoiensis TaxID=2014871 RepID=A0A402A8P9_9CHLR|nr:hypothetical protein KTT_51900 [Tengunoibacter tsumagoiensis]
MAAGYLPEDETTLNAQTYDLSLNLMHAFIYPAALVDQQNNLLDVNSRFLRLHELPAVEDIPLDQRNMIALAFCKAFIKIY